MTQNNLPGQPFTPSDEDVAGLNAWFAQYDALATQGKIQELADLAIFPLNLATDTLDGFGAVGQWSREEFISTMSEVMGNGTGNIDMKSVRTPHFLTANLAIVVSETTVTIEGQQQSMRYADLLVRTADGWGFQTMIQGGWGDAWPVAHRG